MSLSNRPLAAPGLVSYRYLGRYGWVMIGAKGTADALRQAERSVGGTADPSRLEIWGDRSYVPNDRPCDQR